MKIFILIAFLLAGAWVLTIIDHLLGINFTQVSMQSQIIHKAGFMIFGSCGSALIVWCKKS